MKLSIIIPVYNEEATAVDVLEAIHALVLHTSWTKEVLVVNDCSTDNTLSRIRQWMNTSAATEFQLIDHKQNTGKGGAIASGIAQASGEYIIFQDGDLELFPSDINLLVDVVENEGVDIVYGSRLLTAESKASFTPKNRWANQGLSWITSLLLMRRVSDMETCYKLIRTALLRQFDLKEQRFGIEPELTMKLLKDRKVSYAERAIRYESRSVEEGKKIGWKDGFRAVYCLFRYRFIN